MTDEFKTKYLRLVRELSADVVAQLGLARMKLGDQLPAAESANFVTNVCVAALALSIELLVEELKGQTELDPNADDNVYEIKKKLGEAIQPIIAEMAGPHYAVLRKTVELDDEPSEENK